MLQRVRRWRGKAQAGQDEGLFPAAQRPGAARQGEHPLKSNAVSASFSPEPFVSGDEETFGIEELADLDQGSTQDFPIQGYAVTQAWAQKYPNTLKAFTTALSQGRKSPKLTAPPWRRRSRSTWV
jgi:hypothetical protein